MNRSVAPRRGRRSRVRGSRRRVRRRLRLPGHEHDREDGHGHQDDDGETAARGDQDGQSDGHRVTVGGLRHHPVRGAGRHRRARGGVGCEGSVINCTMQILPDVPAADGDQLVITAPDGTSDSYQLWKPEPRLRYSTDPQPSSSARHHPPWELPRLPSWSGAARNGTNRERGMDATFQDSRCR